MSVPIAVPGRPRRQRLPPAGMEVAEFEVRLPGSLPRFGGSVRASLVGAAGAPVVVVLGGISANRFPCLTGDGSKGWWHGIAGRGSAIDPANFQILGLDFAADESGRIGPSTRDQAEVLACALDRIGANLAHAIVGASYGGMAALAFGQHFPDRVGRLAIISAPAEPHPASTAVRELQRRIVSLGMANGDPHGALSIARGLAMLTYRTAAEFERRFAGGIEGEDALAPSEPGAYLRARGEAYRSVMSAGRFLSLSASIDRHRVDPERIAAPGLIIGSSSDQLVPQSQVEDLARRYGGPAEIHILPSLYGHDMFLKDAAQVSGLVGPFLRKDI